MLALWCKLLKTNNDRYTKICFLQLLKLRSASYHDVKYNWCSQLQDILCSLGFQEIWERQDVQEVEQNFDLILEKLQDSLHDQDLVRIDNSHYNTTFKCILDPSRTFASYFNWGLPLVTLRFLCQLRLAGENFSVISFATTKSYFDTTNHCDLCSMNVDDSLWHFFCSCPVLTGARQRYLGKESIGFYEFLGLLKSLGKDDCKATMDTIILFYKAAAKERNFAKELFAEFDELLVVHNVQ